VLLLAAAIAFGIDRWTLRTSRMVEREHAIGRLSPRRATLEASINRSMAVLQGVASHLGVHWGRPDLNPFFDAYAEEVCRWDSTTIRSVQYLRDGVIDHVWPAEGNEPAEGQNLLTDPRPEIGADLRMALERGTISIAGPLSLYQGGQGLIGRLRVDIPGDSVSVVAAIVLDFPAILAASGLAVQDSMSWRLVDSTGHLLAGVEQLDQRDGGPIELAVVLPDRKWRLQGVPATGWAIRVAERQLPLRLTLLGSVLLAGLLAWVIQSRRLTRREAELNAQRLQGEEKFRLLFEMVPDGVILVRAEDGLVLETNDAYCQIVRRPRDAILGRTMLEAGLWASAEERAEGRRVLGEVGKHHEVPFGIGLPDGGRREGIYSATRVILDGTPCYLCVVRDVHDRLLAEQRRADGDRLQAIGRLAGGIAHDFNNLITGISGYAELLENRIDDDDPRREDIHEIRRAAGRAAELTQRLLTFARRQVITPKVVDLAQQLREGSGLLRQLAGDSVRLHLDLPVEPAVVRIDPVQFDQLLHNLTTNARDAMPKGGELTIRLTKDERVVLLTVDDTGEGIAREHVSHLFEPFYTTKAVGAGTGLGLAMVHGIVDQAGGTIEVDSTVGVGTTFTIRFPRTSGIVTPEPEVTATLPMTGGTETILLAEDEPQVLSFTTRVLERLGYRVLAAVDGEDALRISSANHGSLHLLLTDMTMPGMGGAELVRRLRENHPSLRVLLMSGYSEELVSSELPEHPFLPKPFTTAELAEAVRRTLDS
jgi:PAS domain S-box-containing protein